MSEFKKYWKTDLLAGFQVFLVALPLSLGVAMASGFPPLAGLIASIVSGLVVALMSGTYVGINGPAAGLIVIILSGVQSLDTGLPGSGYPYALAAIVITGLLQVLLSRCRADKLSSYFPAAAVHGMLAAIGIMIVAQQLHVLLGHQAQGHNTLEVIAALPGSLMQAHPQVSAIGLLCLGVAFGWKYLPAFLRCVPTPLAILLSGTLAAWLLALPDSGPEQMLNLPDSLLQGLVRPDFGRWQDWAFWKLVLTLTLIASIESLMSALAVDKLDPLQRRANLQKDLQAVGVGTTLSGLLGGLPVITEIVRSSANVAQGGRSRWANFFHGALMLLCVVLLPLWLEQIPLVALAALLIHTGLKLTAPAHFYSVYRIGPEQCLIFVITLVATLATDLLIGMACGIACNLAVHRWLGINWKHMFTLNYQRHNSDGVQRLQITGPVVFSNLRALKSLLSEAPHNKQLIDLSGASLLDHTTMDYFEQIQATAANARYEIQGLEGFEPLSAHPLATRRRAEGTGG